MSPPHDIVKVIFAWCLLAWFGASLALLIGALAVRSEIVDKLWHPTAFLLFWLSGAAFMVDWLPKPAQEIVLLLPMVHGVELLRDGYLGPVVRTHYSVSYLAGACLVLTAFGLVQERVVSKTLTLG
jgi:ABC-type polysaccharide/polyol phosphate export permease